MQRDSSTSDWDVVVESDVSTRPRRNSTFRDEDFFSSGQFHRVDLADVQSSENATRPFNKKQQEDEGANHTRDQHTLPSPGFAAGSDADIESPISHHNRDSHPQPMTPTTPSTAGSAGVYGGTAPRGGGPTELCLNGRDALQGFPSTTSVDSMFYGGGAGGFTHFSPFKGQTTGTTGYSAYSTTGMPPSSYSSSSMTTPTSPPPLHPVTFPADTAAPSPTALRISSGSCDGSTVMKPPLSQQAAASSKAAQSSFRPPLVPKLQLPSAGGDRSGGDDGTVTKDTSIHNASPAKQSRAKLSITGSTLMACLTPRIPILLQSQLGGATSVLSDTQCATLRWENPLQSLVRWTMAMLTLDVLHTFSSDANTWTALIGRVMVIMMVCGRLFRTTQDSRNDALVSAQLLRRRLQEHVASCADSWATTWAIGVHQAMRVVVLDNKKHHLSSSPNENSLQQSPLASSPSSAPSKPLVPPPLRSAPSAAGGWIDSFHACCRVALVCGAVEVICGHSPFGAQRLLDVTIFWMSFAALRVPLRIVLSNLLVCHDGTQKLRKSFLGPVGTSYLVKCSESVPSIRKLPSDVVCWLGLQTLFASCQLCSL